MRWLVVLGVAALLGVALASVGGARVTALPCNAETDPATAVTSTGATLNGQLGVYPADAEFCDQFIFDYGKTIAYGSSTPPGGPFEGGPVPVSAVVTGLTPDTTYHFRIEASDGDNNIGSDLTFHTLPAPPAPALSGAALDLSSSASPASITSGSTTVFSIVVNNRGPSDAGQVIVRDTLPSSLTFVSAGSTVGSCSGTATITCVVGILGAGNRATIMLVASASGTGTLANTATVDSPDNVNPDRSATATVTVTSPPPPPQPSTTTTSTATTTTTTTTTAEKPPPSLVLDRSIDGVSIGMTQDQVEKQLGKPGSTLPIELPGGHGVQAQYRLHGAPFIVIYDADGHVVSLQTYSTYFRSAGGLGPGSSLTLVAALPGFRHDFCELGYWNGTGATKPTAIVTVFTPNGGIVDSVLITELQLWTACATGSQETAPPITLTVNRSIGGISIGMTEQAVIALYGRPLGTLKITLGGGKSGKSVRYRVHGAPLLITYDSLGHVVSIETYSPFFRTAGNLGPGAALISVKQLPGFHADYCELGYWNGTAHTPPNHVITVFTPQGGLVASVLITQLRLYTACATGSTELPPA